MAYKIIDECYPYLQSIGLTGMGETLFAPTLQEVARYIKSKKKSIVTFISTNANIPDFIEKITPVLPFIDTVQISTDGVGATYETIRHGASFEMLERNISALMPLAIAHKLDVMFNMVITKLNCAAMPHVIEFAAGHGVRFVNFTYFNLASVTRESIEYYRFFASEDFKEILSATKTMAQKHPEVEVTGLDFPGNPGIRKCPLMWNHYQINHDGEIPPCCAKPFSKEFSFGNVSEASVMDVLNSGSAKRFRQSWISGQPHVFCQKCHFVHL
ncbi:MAG: SPASM domain-containing protein [Ruminococcus flavefaciens]|nr:SPASM domain-containing protein [Ruminococcus flavefaciens]